MDNLKTASKNLVIVTGGCGYIGSHTIVDLMNNGFDVISIDNFSNSSSKTIDNIEKITGEKIININIDLCNYDEVVKTFTKYKHAIGVIHFAASKSVPESVLQPLFYYKNNLQSLTNVLAAMQTNNIKNFVFSSSCSVYGDIDKMPVSENTILSEAKSPYGRTKQIGEKIILDYSTAYNGNNILLRYFNPVGAHTSGMIGELPINKPSNLVPVITQTAIGINKQLTVFGGNLATRDGSCIRDYIHVMDIASAHTLAIKTMLAVDVKYEIINLGTGNGVSVFEAINTFEKISGLKVNYVVGPYREGDVIEIYSDNTKAATILKWVPKFGINEMMATAWEWQKKLEVSHLAKTNVH